MLSMSSTDGSESLPPSLIEAKGSEAQVRRDQGLRKEKAPAVKLAPKNGYPLQEGGQPAVGVWCCSFGTSSSSVEGENS